MALYQITPPTIAWQRPEWPYALNAMSSHARGLVAWVPIARGLKDLSGKSQVTSVTGGATMIGSAFGSALACDGTGDAMTLADHVSLNVGSGDCSVALWMYPIAFGTYKSIFGKGLSTAARELMFLIDSTSVGYVSVGNTGGAATFSPVFVLGVWQHVVFSRTGSTVTVYRNGVSCASIASINGVATYTEPLHFGLNSVGGAGASDYNGLYADVRVWNRAQTLTEVKHLYDPRTRWDLYRLPYRRAWSNIVAAAGGAVRLRMRPMMGMGA